MHWPQRINLWLNNIIFFNKYVESGKQIENWVEIDITEEKDHD